MATNMQLTSRKALAVHTTPASLAHQQHHGPSHESVSKAAPCPCRARTPVSHAQLCPAGTGTEALKPRKQCSLTCTASAPCVPGARLTRCHSSSSSQSASSGESLSPLCMLHPERGSLLSSTLPDLLSCHLRFPHPSPQVSHLLCAWLLFSFIFFSSQSCFYRNEISRGGNKTAPCDSDSDTEEISWLRLPWLYITRSLCGL